MKTRLIIATTAAALLACSVNANAQFLEHLRESALRAAEQSIEMCITRGIQRGIERSYERTERRIENRLDRLCKTNILLTNYENTGHDVIVCSDENALDVILLIQHSNVHYDRMAVLSREEMRKMRRIERITL